MIKQRGSNTGVVHDIMEEGERKETIYSQLIKTESKDKYPENYPMVRCMTGIDEIFVSYCRFVTTGKKLNNIEQIKKSRKIKYRKPEENF